MIKGLLAWFVITQISNGPVTSHDPVVCHGNLTAQLPAVTDRNLTLIYSPYNFNNQTTVSWRKYHTGNWDTVPNPDPRYSFRTEEMAFAMTIIKVAEADTGTMYLVYDETQNCFSNKLNISVEAPAKQPLLQINELKEDHLINITCRSDGRPAPTLRILIGNDEVPDLVQTQEIDTLSGMNNGLISLNYMKREWDAAKLSCCAELKVDSVGYHRNVCSNATIDYKFPPTKIELTRVAPDENLSEVKPWYMQKYNCTLIYLKTVCTVHWTMNESPISGENSSKQLQTNVASFVVSFNISREVFASKLQCQTHCDEFPQMKSLMAETSVIFPYLPEKITFDGPDELDVDDLETRTITCKVKSYPKANILWTTGGTTLRQCNGSSECSLSIEGSVEKERRNATQIFYCVAMHQIASDIRNLTVRFRHTQKESTSDQNETSKGPGLAVWLAGGIGAVVIVTGITTFLVCRKKRLRQKKSSRQSDDAVVPTDTLISSAPEYSQINKSLESDKKEDQLVYVDLDKTALSTSTVVKKHIHPDETTEYVDIDFSKTGKLTNSNASQSGALQEDGEEKTYMNTSQF